MKIYLFLFLIASCKSSGFKGNAEQAVAATPSPSPVAVPPVTPVSPPPVAVIPAVVPTPVPCVDDGVIVAKSMTQNILNNQPNQIVIFELTLKDCYGKERVIQTNQIRFDYDATIFRGTPDLLAFKLKTKDQLVLSAGTMERNQGSDLFGNVASNRFYWKTVGDLKIPPATVLLYLEMDVSNLEFHLQQNTKAPFPKTEQINMFLSFGTATPVTTTINYEN